MIISDKRFILVDHSEHMLFYISRYGILPKTELCQNMYNEILHLMPAYLLDPSMEDFNNQLELKTIKLSLQKTDEGLVECKNMITRVLKDLAPHIVVIDSVTRLLYVSMITDSKIYIESENI